MKVHDFDKLESKLRLKTRDAGDRLAWFEYGGKTITRTKRSHGNKEPPAHLIRQQLKLNDQQFRGIITCTLYREDYVRILVKKGLIESRELKKKARTAKTT